MIRLSLVAVCFFCLGAWLYALTEAWRPKSNKPRPVAQQAVLKPLANPILPPDATVQQCTTSYKCGAEKRYYAGMRK